jgi:hypothetical protein
MEMSASRPTGRHEDACKHYTAAHNNSYELPFVVTVGDIGVEEGRRFYGEKLI